MPTYACPECGHVKRRNPSRSGRHVCGRCGTAWRVLDYKARPLPIDIIGRRKYPAVVERTQRAAERLKPYIGHWRKPRSGPAPITVTERAAGASTGAAPTTVHDRPEPQPSRRGRPAAAPPVPASQPRLTQGQPADAPKRVTIFDILGRH
jgi:hypothetical protein